MYASVNIVYLRGLPECLYLCAGQQLPSDHKDKVQAVCFICVAVYIWTVAYLHTCVYSYYWIVFSTYISFLGTYKVQEFLLL